MERLESACPAVVARSSQTPTPAAKMWADLLIFACFGIFLYQSNPSCYRKDFCKRNDWSFGE